MSLTHDTLAAASPDPAQRSGCLKIEGASLTLAGTPLFAPLDASIRAGEVVTVMGPSGCGKSSLLAWLCGTLPPAFAARGRAHLDGVPLEGLAPEARKIGILFQDDLLFPHLSVGDNLAFGLTADLKGRAARRAAVDRALDEAGLSGMADRDPATLSGGQRARVALMRTLLSAPRALLLDEPFSRLDVDLRAQVRGFVFDHGRANAIPTLLVTHDPADAEAAGGEVIHLV